MKKLFLTLLFSSMAYCQTISVRGVSLSYSDVDHTMTLVIPKEVIEVMDSRDKIKVTISKFYSLTINDSKTLFYFYYRGYKNKNMCGFEYESMGKVIFEDFIDKHVYKFHNIESNEYILEVDIPQEESIESNSLIIN
jgi:hypothetical protein